MTKGSRRIALALVASLGMAGCMFERFDASDSFFSTDPTVDQATADKLIGFLLSKAPRIREEKLSLETKAGGAGKVKLIIRVENAPEPNYPSHAPDAQLHRNYYWLYAGYHSKDGILRTYRYLVRKDVGEALVYDDASDDFQKLP